MRMLLSLIATLTFAQQFSPPGMACHERTLVLFAPGPNAAKSRDYVQDHFRYMREQMKAGKIIAAGPFNGETGAADVFTSSDWDEVKTIIHNEPFEQNGVIKVVQHFTWNACQDVNAHPTPVGS